MKVSYVATLDSTCWLFLGCHLCLAGTCGCATCNLRRVHPKPLAQFCRERGRPGVCAALFAVALLHDKKGIYIPEDWIKEHKYFNL
mmetsp:Transcript_11358/g.26339  ORF Transcript_11358/g.26339 Transcript_11358/m.26339 type:complete len:86 (+) Transcript_11358:686-943(+)